AACRFDEEPRAGQDGNADLLGLQHACLSSREHAVAMGPPVAPAKDAVGRMADTVARCVAACGLGRLHPELEDRADTAAMAAVARRIRRELVAGEEEREARLRDLDAAELDAARRLPLARRLPAVPGGRGTAAAARVEEVPDERALRPRVLALDRDAE